MCLHVIFMRMYALEFAMCEAHMNVLYSWTSLIHGWWWCVFDIPQMYICSIQPLDCNAWGATKALCIPLRAVWPECITDGKKGKKKKDVLSPHLYVCAHIQCILFECMRLCIFIWWWATRKLHRWAQIAMCAHSFFLSFSVLCMRALSFIMSISRFRILDSCGWYYDVSSSFCRLSFSLCLPLIFYGKRFSSRCIYTVTNWRRWQTNVQMKRKKAFYKRKYFITSAA